MRDSLPTDRNNTLPIGHDVRGLFLALTIIKSKPAELPMRAYLDQIRKRTRANVCTAMTDDSCNHSESAIYWQMEYKSLRAAQPALHDRIAQLEQQNEDLQCMLKLAASVPPSAGTRSKRKRISHHPEVIDNPAATQNQGRNDPDNIPVTLQPQRDDDQSQFDINELEVYLSSDEENRYCRQIYRLRQLLIQKTLETDVLAVTLVQLSSTLINVLSKSPSLPLEIGPNMNRENRTHLEGQANTESLRTCGSHKETSLQLIARTFHYILEGLDKLDRDGNKRTMENQVTHCIVMIVSNILEQIGRLASIKQPKDLIWKMKTIGVENLVHEPAAAAIYVDKSVSMSICRLLVAILVSLDTTRQSQMDVLEGAMYLILDRVGIALKAFVSDVVLGANDGPPHLKTQKSSADQQRMKIVTKARAEARYLIWILERVMLIYRLSENERGVTSNGLDNNTEHLPQEAVSSIPRTLTEQVKKKLQNTLLTSVFGDGECNFEDGLRLPTDPRLKIDTGLSDLEEKDVAKWFKQEVWRLLAWDVVENVSSKSRGVGSEG